MRVCKCGKHIIDEGFVVDSGATYYCSEKCPYQDISSQEWEMLCSLNDGTYWTSWDTIWLTDDFEISIDAIRDALLALDWGSLEEYLPRFKYEDIAYLKQAILAFK